MTHFYPFHTSELVMRFTRFWNCGSPCEQWSYLWTRAIKGPSIFSNSNPVYQFPISNKIYLSLCFHFCFVGTWQIRKWVGNVVFQNAEVAMRMLLQLIPRHRCTNFLIKKNILIWDSNGLGIFLDKTRCQIAIPMYVHYISKMNTYKLLPLILTCLEKIVQWTNFQKGDWHLMLCLLFFQIYQNTWVNHFLINVQNQLQKNLVSSDSMRQMN